MRIQIQECLPAAQSMQDIDSIAHIRFSCARFRLGRRESKQDEAQTIFDELAESFALKKQIQRVDGIGAVGSLFGQVLAMAGQVDQALAVLEESAAAFDQLAQTDQATQVRELQEWIRKGNG